MDRRRSLVSRLDPASQRLISSSRICGCQSSMGTGSLAGCGSRLIRTYRRSPSVPAPSARDVGRSLAAGYNEFLPKPVDTDRLLDCLQRYLDLEWHYDGCAAELSPATGPLMKPPPEELAAVDQALRVGDYRCLREEAERLQQQPEYAQFAERLMQLVVKFDERAIAELLATASDI